MLYLTRKIGESVIINDDIEVTVVDIRGREEAGHEPPVVIGLVGPPVDRQEIDPVPGTPGYVLLNHGNVCGIVVAEGRLLRRGKTVADVAIREIGREPYVVVRPDKVPLVLVRPVAAAGAAGQYEQADRHRN